MIEIALAAALLLNPHTFTWNAPVGPQPVSTYTVKCGNALGGPYPLAASIAAPTTTLPVANVVTIRGTYFCVVTASNIAGESGASNEVSFQVETAPSPPGGFTVVQ